MKETSEAKFAGFSFCKERTKNKKNKQNIPQKQKWRDARKRIKVKKKGAKDTKRRTLGRKGLNQTLVERIRKSK